MSKKKYLVLILIAAAMLLITSCNCSNEAVAAYEVFLDNPVGDVVVNSLNPNFEWHGSDSCEPDNFRLAVKENIYNGPSTSEDISGDTSSHTLTGASLEPGREYLWSMHAWNDYDPQESGDRSGPESQKGRFFTGPVCSGETLVAPEIEFPKGPRWSESKDNWITHGHDQKFKWSYSGTCLPISYDYQFASDAAFSGIVLSGTTSDPYLMHTVQNFPNCSSLFWRVRANDGTSAGPWSEIEQFHWVEDETCYQTHYISDDAARIYIRLFHDVCGTTGYSSSSAASFGRGCYQWPDNMVTGNTSFGGLDYNLYDYRVNLGAGPCPSTGLDSKMIDHFHEPFNVLAPGTYCISIDKDQSVANGSGTGMQDLTKGTWTEPRTNDQVAGITVELGTGIQDVRLEFGWDEYDFPILYYPIPENLNCRIGPDTICDPLRIPLAGEILPLVGRDQETEWKMTSYQGQQCFVYLLSEEIDQALIDIGPQPFLTADLPIFDPQPPCPTPTPKPNQGAPRKTCSQYTSSSACIEAGCQWYIFGSGGNCTGP